MNTRYRMLFLAALSCLISVVPGYSALAGDFVEVAQLTASDAGGVAHFGSSSAVDGDTAFIGAPSSDGSRGAVYAFRFDGASWVEEQKLVASDGVAGDLFGFSVSLDGDAALIGARDHDAVGLDNGAAYVFRFDGLTWVEEQKLTASDAVLIGERFGSSVSLQGDVALIGAPEAEASDGAVYAFRFDGTTWNEQQKLIAVGGAVVGMFGGAVAMDGQVAVIGSNRGSAFMGEAHVFRFDGSVWNQEQKLIASEVGAAARFGWSVGVDGETAMVGAHRDGPTGSVFVFRFDGTSWVEEQKLTASDGLGDQFGLSVALDGGVALIGDTYSGNPHSGSAHVYRFDGTTWIEAQKLTASDGLEGDQFGFSVALDGDVALSGASARDGAVGSAYIFSGVSCVAGAVNSGVGKVTDVLVINGMTRVAQVVEGEFVYGIMFNPPAGGPGRYMLHANVGWPTTATQHVLPASAGTFCFSAFLSQGATPVGIWNNAGKPAKLGTSQYLDGTPIPDPPVAPAVFLQLFGGDTINLPVGAILTFQGMIADNGSPSSLGGSVTNAVVLKIL